jgi:Uma2 family endonuclease
VGENRLTVPVLLVVEIISGGSRTQDTVTKRAVYADAGIPAYWILDPEADELTALRLDASSRYQSYGQGQTLTVEWPMHIEVDVPALGRRPA